MRRRTAMKICQVEIVLNEGPVVLPSLQMSGVQATHSLWNDISAHEFFPANTNSAFYVLSLAKPVDSAEAVPSVEGELVSALQLLAAAWPFSGGSFMALETRELVISARFQSNAEQVRRELLARDGQTPVTAKARVAYEALATYRAAPLGAASAIARAAVSKYSLRKLLHYHQTAWLEYYHRKRTDRSSWFIELYKVRDLLQKIHGAAARSQLGIAQSDWTFFGRVLNNNDLRHAEVSGTPPTVSQSDVDRLYQLARAWAVGHMTTLGLQVL